MKSFLFTLFILITFAANARKIHLRYEPKGQIVKFCFEGLTIYTDTITLFAVYDQFGNKTPYDQRVKNFVRKSIKEIKNDTVNFTGEFIPFNDGIDNGYQNTWFIEWPLLHLLQEAKLVVYDTHNNIVKTIITRKIGKKRKHFVKRSYINKATGEEIMKQVLFFRTITPSF